MTEKEISLEEIIATETEVDKAINKLNSLNRKRGLLCDVFLCYRLYEYSHCNECGIEKETIKHVLCSSYDAKKNERIANIINVEKSGYVKDENKPIDQNFFNIMGGKIFGAAVIDGKIHRTILTKDYKEK